MTDCQKILDEISNITGWDENSQLIMVCRFIELEGLEDDLKEFLMGEADLEDEMGTEFIEDLP